MSFIISGPDSRFSVLADDIRVNISSGILVLGDGTPGGAPLSGINFGIPDTGIKSVISRPSGLVGYSHQRFMNEFPRYSRISRDPVSMGAQLLTPISYIYDEILDQTRDFFDSQYLRFYPTYEQGTVYEYNFAEANDLDINPPVSGILDTNWFTVPITQDESQFWLAPPTRLETTNSEISGLTVFDWTGVWFSGINTVFNQDFRLPLYNQLWLNVSGSLNFRRFVTEEDEALFAEAIIYGKWPQDSLRPDSPIRREVIRLDRNGPFHTLFPYREINRVDIVGLTSGSFCKLETFNFNARFRADPYIRHQNSIRDDLFNTTLWHNVTSGLAFSGIVQTESPRPWPHNEELGYLVNTYINTDTILDRDIEFDIINVWQLAQDDGTFLSGVIDVRPVPHSRYILALDKGSRCWVYDTFQPAFNMTGKTETTESSLRILLEWPYSNEETAGNYSVSLGAETVNAGVGLQRWRWTVDIDGASQN